MTPQRILVGLLLPLVLVGIAMIHRAHAHPVLRTINVGKNPTAVVVDERIGHALLLTIAIDTAPTLAVEQQTGRTSPASLPEACIS